MLRRADFGEGGDFALDDGAAEGAVAFEQVGHIAGGVDDGQFGVEGVGITGGDIGGGGALEEAEMRRIPGIGLGVGEYFQHTTGGEADGWPAAGIEEAVELVESGQRPGVRALDGLGGEDIPDGSGGVGGGMRGEIAGEDGGREAGFGEADPAGEATDARAEDGDGRVFDGGGKHAREYSRGRCWITKVTIQ